VTATRHQFDDAYFGRILAPTWITEASRVMDAMDPVAIRTELPLGKATPGALLMLPAIPLPRDHGLPVGIPVAMEALGDSETLVCTWQETTGMPSEQWTWFQDPWVDAWLVMAKANPQKLAVQAILVPDVSNSWPLPKPVLEMQMAMAAAMMIDHLQQLSLTMKQMDALQRYLVTAHKYIKMTSGHGTLQSTPAQTPILFAKVWPPTALCRAPFLLHWWSDGSTQVPQLACLDGWQHVDMSKLAKHWLASQGLPLRSTEPPIARTPPKRIEYAGGPVLRWAAIPGPRSDSRRRSQCFP